jgi:hypothetical protein
MDWGLLISYLLLFIAGGWTVHLAINNLLKGSFFWFGIQLFGCVYIAALLVRLQLL